MLETVSWTILDPSVMVGRKDKRILKVKLKGQLLEGEPSMAVSNIRQIGRNIKLIQEMIIKVHRRRQKTTNYRLRCRSLLMNSK